MWMDVHYTFTLLAPLLKRSFRLVVPCDSIKPTHSCGHACISLPS